MISLVYTLGRFLRGMWYAFRDPEFRGLFVFVVLLHLTGKIFYSSVEHWRPLDSFYFTVTTLATVGFGDFTPRTDVGKIFTVLYILIGVGTLLGFINVIAHHTRKNDPIHQYFRKKDSSRK